MGIKIGTAVFDDAMTKFFLFDSSVNKVFCPLFPDEEAALVASRNARGICSIPPSTSHDKSESVTLFFYLDESGKGVCTRSYSNTGRTHITCYHSLEYYQRGIPG